MLLHPLQSLEFGIQSEKFVDIDKVSHRFPENLKNCGFGVTLLHNHHHCPINYVLAYQNNFTEAVYVTREEAQKEFFPCSWFWGDNIVAYEFCDQNIPFDMPTIKSNLQCLQEQGYSHNGTTVRPIQNVNEFESKNGHRYIPIF